MSNNRNGFEDAINQLKTVAKINEKTSLDALEEAADYFVNKLKPELVQSGVSKKHMVDALTIKIEKGKVIVLFEEFGWYWYMVEHGHKKSNGKGSVRGTFTIKKTVDQEKLKLEKIMKESILKKL